MDSLEDLSARFKEAAQDEARSTISITIGEYLDPDIERKDWDYRGLAKWAMSRFNVSLSLTHLAKQEPVEIEEQLISSAMEKLDRFDFSPLNRCLDSNYSRSALADWTKNKFNVAVRLQDIVELSPKTLTKFIGDQVHAAYHRREIEFPVDFALSNTLLAQEQTETASSAGALVDWVNHKYNAGWKLEDLQNQELNQIRNQIVQLAEDFMDKGKLEDQIDQAIAQYDDRLDELAQWAKQRFLVDLDIQNQTKESIRDPLVARARSFLRSELTHLEEFVLLNVYDSVWKEHLLGMDHLKGAIGLRGYAERDPKIEYKREGTQMFHRMLDSIREQVTDLILKVHISGSMQARSVWQNQQTQHAEASQFSAEDRQAAMQQQGEAQAAKTIRRDVPKVKPNDPCSCGSGKKFKKCCGKNHG
ncbi:MAG: SEC-C metal-binding domain-containing protein [Phycisphaerae bacterium]